MQTFTPNAAAGPGRTLRNTFAETLQRQLTLLERGTGTVRVPVTTSAFQRAPGMAYHFKPELFIQREGSTAFSIAGGDGFSLDPDGLCVMPRGVPHGEQARAGRRPFENMVVCFYSDTVAMHIARSTPEGVPAVDDIHFFTTSLYEELVGYLNRIGELATRKPGPTRDLSIRGLLIAELSMLLTIVQESGESTFSSLERVGRCQWLIRNNLGDSELGVESLAAELRCSPSYLSKIFQCQTGEKIVAYITRYRVQTAIDAILEGRLTVKEIASACGFGQPGYFAKVFRKATGFSPHEYRAELARRASKLEPEPKVVYHDREEHDFGLRAEVRERASSSVAP